MERSSKTLPSQKEKAGEKEEETTPPKTVEFKKLTPDMTIQKLKIGVHGLQKTGKSRATYYRIKKELQKDLPKNKILKSNKKEVRWKSGKKNKSGYTTIDRFLQGVD